MFFGRAWTRPRRAALHIFPNQLGGKTRDKGLRQDKPDETDTAHTRGDTKTYKKPKPQAVNCLEKMQLSYDKGTDLLSLR